MKSFLKQIIFIIIIIFTCSITNKTLAGPKAKKPTPARVPSPISPTDVAMRRLNASIAHITNTLLGTVDIESSLSSDEKEVKLPVTDEVNEFFRQAVDPNVVLSVLNNELGQPSAMAIDLQELHDTLSTLDRELTRTEQILLITVNHMLAQTENDFEKIINIYINILRLKISQEPHSQDLQITAQNFFDHVHKLEETTENINEYLRIIRSKLIKLRVLLIKYIDSRLLDTNENEILIIGALTILIRRGQNDQVAPARKRARTSVRKKVDESTETVQQEEAKPLQETASNGDFLSLLLRSQESRDTL